VTAGTAIDGATICGMVTEGMVTEGAVIMVWATAVCGRPMVRDAPNAKSALRNM